MNIHAPSFTRRRFLRLLGQGALLSTLPGPLLAQEANAVTISLLHTTDLHGHILPTSDYSGHPDLGGLARCVTQIRRWQNENPHSLLLDIGDVYQGTQVGLGTRGAIMIRCLNALAYDAWAVGNHEFDWGMDIFSDALKLSAMPILSGNALVEGRPVGSLSENAGPLAKLKPYLIKEVTGFRLAIIGLTTPALTSWLPPENLRGFEMLDPSEALRGLLREVSMHQPDAIIVAGHMGFIREDDEANRVGALTREFPEIAAFLGGHTHQNHSSETVNGVLYTQADHFGIYAGKVDLTFDRASRKLLRREAVTVPMDHTIAADPLILSLAAHDLDDAAHVLASPIGELVEMFSVESVPGRPSDVERLIASAMRAALEKRGVEVDVVMHGLFDTNHSFAAGPKTVGDIWPVLPYENHIVTVDLSRDDLLAMARDFSGGHEFRSIMGLRLVGEWQGRRFVLTDLRAADGAPLPDKPAYRVALNSYDSQSAGGRFPVAARLVADPANRRVLHAIEIRGALIDFFLAKKKVSRASLLV